ncbi:TPA: hypothetical protein ACQDQH_002755 [Legionella pneumophila]
MANYQEYYGELSRILWRTIKNIMANYQEYYGELSRIYINFNNLCGLTIQHKKNKNIQKKLPIHL